MKSVLLLAMFVLTTFPVAVGAQTPFAVQDQRLLKDPNPCKTDVTIKAFTVGDTTIFSIGAGPAGDPPVLVNGRVPLWCHGAKHTWKGQALNVGNGAIAAISSSKDRPLRFIVDKNKGYIYLEGKGTIEVLKGLVVNLPPKK